MMFNQITRILESMAGDKKLLAATASVYYNMFRSLVDAGFTEDQAIRIVCSHSVLPSGSNNRAAAAANSNSDEG